MNKIKQILIGVSALALSGNAAATIINEDGSGTMHYHDYRDMIQDVMDGVYNDTSKDERRSAKIAKKQGRIDYKKELIATGDVSKSKRRSLKKRISRLKTKIASIMTKMDIMGRLPDSIVLALNGEGENENVPEPSTIALLGLGLVGIGVARRLRKKAR